MRHVQDEAGGYIYICGMCGTELTASYSGQTWYCLTCLDNSNGTMKVKMTPKMEEEVEDAQV